MEVDSRYMYTVHVDIFLYRLVLYSEGQIFLFFEIEIFVVCLLFVKNFKFANASKFAKFAKIKSDEINLRAVK